MGTLLGAICMFLNGFVTLIPYHIVLCATRVIKKFHLTTYSVSLFVYKFHYPMEFANLIATAAAFVLSFINELFFGNRLIIKRYLSFISMWITFVATVISYLTFTSGGDYGNFQYFYWSIILMTLSNGFSSCLAFAVNSNCTMYAAGIPVSSFTTFILQKTYKYFYNKYFWGEYDYKLVVVQYMFNMFFLALTGALWTVDQLIQIINDDKNNSGSTPSIDIDAGYILSITGRGSYGSGTNQITVIKEVGGVAGGSNNPIPQNYVGYKHHKTVGGTFNLDSVKHNDQLLDGIQPENNVTAVYVYYTQSGDEKHEFPLIVCVSKSSSHTYYQRGNKWTEVTDPRITNGPETPGVAKKLKEHLPKIAEKYEVKLGEITGYKGHPQSSHENITVTAIEQQNGNDYKGFKHEVADKSVNRITIHGQPIKGIYQNVIDVFTFQSGGGIYVYFPLKGTDPELHKPLLICLSLTGSKGNGNVWYKRETGLRWTNVKTTFTSNHDPNDIVALVTQLTNISSKVSGDTGYTKPQCILKLDYRPVGTNEIKYVTGNEPTPSKRVITVAQGTDVPSGYVAYEHKPPIGSSHITSPILKFNGKELEGFHKNGITIQSSKPFKVYYKNGDTLHPKPLLVYFQTSENSNNHKLYGRGTYGTKWRDMNYNETSEPDGNKLQPYLNMMSRQGTFLELICFDNLSHWSPILMLSFSIGTIYAAYPIIAPHRLIDPERADAIDLCILLASTIPSIVLAVLDLEKVEYGPSNKWDKNSLFHHHLWFGGLIYVICIYVFISTIRTPDGWIGKRVKDNLYVVSFFGIILNITQKLMESSALGGGPVQSHDGFVGSISQFNILLMISLRLLITLFCDGYFKTLTHVDTYPQPYTYLIQSPWSPFLITSTLKINQIPSLDPPQDMDIV